MPPAPPTRLCPDRAVASATIASAVGLGLALLAWQQGLVSRLYPAKVALLLAAGSVLVLHFSRVRHPHRAFGPANQVTTGRAMLAVLLVGAVGEAPTGALALVAALVGTAVVSLDGLDGSLARRSGLASQFGARFDMEVDALVVLVLCVLAWQHDKAGAWVVTSGLLRYLFVAAGWPWPWMERPLPPSKRRQAMCVVQIVALLVVLAPFVRPPSSSLIAALSVALLCWSFFIDVRWLRQQRRSPL